MERLCNNMGRNQPSEWIVYEAQFKLQANLEVNKIGKLLKEGNRFKMYFTDKNEKQKLGSVSREKQRKR